MHAKSELILSLHKLNTSKRKKNEVTKVGKKISYKCITLDKFANDVGIGPDI